MFVNGNGGWSETNFTTTVKVVDYENPLFVARIGDISPVYMQSPRFVMSVLKFVKIREF